MSTVRFFRVVIAVLLATALQLAEPTATHGQGAGLGRDCPLPGVTSDSGTQAIHTLGVTVSSSGTVASGPAGIDCSSGTCRADYKAGTSVRLWVVRPGNGWRFSGWSGAYTRTGSCSVTMSAARGVTATFTRSN